MKMEMKHFLAGTVNVHKIKIYIGTINLHHKDKINQLESDEFYQNNNQSIKEICMIIMVLNLMFNL